MTTLPPMTAGLMYFGVRTGDAAMLRDLLTAALRFLLACTGKTCFGTCHPDVLRTGAEKRIAIFDAFAGSATCCEPPGMAGNDPPPRLLPPLHPAISNIPAA